MHEARASRTAFRVAVHRAAHQVLDHPRIFDDPLAVKIIGKEAAANLASERASPALRAFMATRSRFAEDVLAQAVKNGTRQYVVLGAGLDTFAYRNPHAAVGLRVFEVDHPATQAWKEDRLRAGGIAIPPDVVFVPVDFERRKLSEAMRESGLRMDAPAFFSWLGVVPYLTERAFVETVEFIASMPERSGVVFDYGVSRSALKPAEQVLLDALAARVAAAGEPFQLFFEPEELADRMRRMGFGHVEDLGREEMNARYFDNRADGFRLTGNAHLLSARV